MLDVQQLSVRRAGRRIVRDVGFRLAPGEALLVTGANGCGKSTLLRALAGLLPVDQGNILWQGASITADTEGHAARLHYIGHLDALKPELTGHEMLRYWSALRDAVEPTDDRFGIAAFIRKPIRALSAGQKRRLTLTRLALADAPLWLLDEPTTALDADGRRLLLQAIATHRAKGGIVVAAMHHALDAPDVRNLHLEPRP